MKEQYKKPWIEALRSGKYKQGQTELHSLEHNTFCCLGVLAAVAGYEANEYKHGGEEDSDCGEEYLNTALMEEFNITLDDQYVLARMNDGGFDDLTNKQVKQSSFKKIADYIEKNL